MARILCIEDERDYRESLVEYLAGEGHEMIEAVNGEEGLAAILRTKPDLVLSDVGMPKKSGFELLSTLRTEYPERANIPFIFLTALGQKKDMVNGRMLGADDYLIKPVDLELLSAAVKSKLQQAKRIKNLIHEEMNDFKGAILQLMAHELHTPLNAIIGFTDMIKSEIYGPLENDKYRELVNGTSKSGYRLLGLVNNAIDIMLLVAEKFKPVPQPIEVESLVWECAYTLKSMGYPDACEIIQRVEPDLPMLNADLQLLNRALIGVLGEAVTNKSHGGKLLVGASLNAKEQMVFMIADASQSEKPDYLSSKLEKVTEMINFLDYPLAGFLDARAIAFQFAQAVTKAHGGEVFVQRDEKEIKAAYFVFPKSSLV